MKTLVQVSLLCLFISASATAATAQTSFSVFPGTKFCTEPIPVNAVFTRSVFMTAGSLNHFLTSSTSGWLFQGVSPDPVMLLVSPTGTIVAFNDDFVGLDSDIVFTPTTTGTFRLIVHSFSTASAGFTTVLRSVNGAPPTSFGTSTKFGGTRVMTDWNAGIRFDTAGGNADTVLLLFEGTGIGATLDFNDDLTGTPGFLQGPLSSSITPATSAHGGLTDNRATTAIVGAFSSFTEGQTVLCQSFRSWMSPLLSPPRDVPTPAGVPGTKEMTQYLREYEKLKSKLTDMDPGPRDEEILSLQRRILPESQIRTFLAPPSFATAAFVRAQKEYLARAQGLEKELTSLDHAGRSEMLEKLKSGIMAPAVLRVEPDYGLSWEPVEGRP